MAIKVVDSAHLGKAIVEMLGKAEITLKDTVSSGTLIDYGSGVKEWSFKYDTKFSATGLFPVIEINPNLFLHYNFFTVTLPDNLRGIPILNLQANLEASDNILNKACTVKSISSSKVRVDFSGMAKVRDLAPADKPVTYHIKMLFQFPV